MCLIVSIHSDDHTRAPGIPPVIRGIPRRFRRPLDNLVASGGDTLTVLGRVISFVFPITLPCDDNGAGNLLLLDLGEKGPLSLLDTVKYGNGDAHFFLSCFPVIFQVIPAPFAGDFLSRRSSKEQAQKVELQLCCPPTTVKLQLTDVLRGSTASQHCTSRIFLISVSECVCSRGRARVDTA